MKQNGQVVIILLLIIVIGLAIGLSIVGRSTSEIATSSKTEQSTRAFSAAQAGIERSIQESNNNPANSFSSGFSVTPFINQSSASVAFGYNLPNPGQGLEYPPFGKESYGQFWLADPGTLALSYASSSFYVYFGQPTTPTNPYTNTEDEPAIEVDVIMFTSGVGYSSRRYYFDSNITDLDRANTGSPGYNNFQTCTPNPPVINTNYGNNRNFLCQATVNFTNSVTEVISSSFYPVMVRIRILYSSLSHPVAIVPTAGSSIPPQAKMFTSTGTVGSITRTIQVFQEHNVLPQYLDYALFSSNNVVKN